MEFKESWELLGTGSSKEFVDSLCREAKEHAAAKHPYLEKIANGEFKNTKKILKDYAFNYSFYSREFPRYVEAVIGGLENLEHRNALLENLNEEKGIPGSTKLAEMPHVELFSMFRRAVGIDENYFKEHKPCTTALVWRDLFLQKCQSRQEGVGAGAIGIATEYIVPQVYNYFIEGIKNHTDLAPDDYFFFELHAHADDEHAEDLNKIIVDLSEQYSTREAIRFGVISALNLRKSFWDVMLSRSLDIR